MWFRGFVTEPGRRPVWPWLEPDRLTVAVQASGSKAYCRIAGELFTLADLRAFADGLRRVQTGGDPWVDLHGTAESLKLTLGQNEEGMVIGQAVLKNPMFDHAHRFGIKAGYRRRLTDIADAIDAIADRLARPR